jgi:hypothetical protein
MIALLRYFSHFTLDCENMTDDELAKTWGQLKYALTKTNQYGSTN